MVLQRTTLDITVANPPAITRGKPAGAAGVMSSIPPTITHVTPPTAEIRAVDNPTVCIALAFDRTLLILTKLAFRSSTLPSNLLYATQASAVMLFMPCTTLVIFSNMGNRALIVFADWENFNQQGFCMLLIMSNVFSDCNATMVSDSLICSACSSLQQKIL